MEAKKFRRRLFLFAAVLTAAFGIAFAFAFTNLRPVEKPIFGITFSTDYAHALGIDAREAYVALLDEVGVRDIRFPLYWSAIEREDGNYDWEETDWYMRTAESRGARVTLVIGAKVPRWPECFIPEWARQLDGPVRQRELLAYLEQAVRRYQVSPAVVRWQVENEPFFPFGECPPPDLGRFLEEVALVRDLDSRPIQLTVSGEFEPWLDAAMMADVLGISMYRVAWNDFFGFFHYPIAPGFYASRAVSVRPLVERVIISELQAEPWFPESIHSRPPLEWYDAFDERDFRRNVDFASRTGLDEAYLWGAEWWYFLREHGESRLWDVATEVFDRRK